MASLPVPDEAVYLHESVVRGRHVYKRVWSPVVGEILQLSREEDNDHDRFSVSVMKAEFIVGHSPQRLLSCTVWHFLRHCGKATCEVTWRRKFRNRLEVPCLYSISSLACSSFALPCQNACRRGYLLERSEWIRSFCHLGSPTYRYRMEKRGENSEVTLRTYAFLTCACASYVCRKNVKKCVLIRGYALNSGVRLLTRLYGSIYLV